MKKFIVYLLVIICTVSLGFGVFYLVRDNEIISISSASMYKDVGESFTLDIDHINKKASTDITITSSDDSIVSGKYNESSGQYNAEAKSGGVARINVRTTNVKFRNIWCDVIVGDGTIESPFYISTAEQLASIGMGAEIMATNEDGTTYGTGVYAGAGKYSKYASNLCYKLVANIDASEVNQGYWVPLRNFNGRLDGNGCTISNIYIDAVGYKTALGDNADALFVSNKPAGLLESVGKDGIVYNLKLDNFTAVGTYSKFGCIAATNMGTIERVEIKKATTNISTGVFGGLVGENVTTETLVEEMTEEGNPIAIYVKNTARIDRCSVRLTHGYSETNGAIATGTIGGLVGINNGGTLVYSYVRGDIYFADDSVANITYGGVVAVNNALELANTGFEGANIKDCYSDIRTNLTSTPSTGSIFAGAVARNVDFANGSVDEHNRVNNYLIGVYYNTDSLNATQDGITKGFKGVGQFTLDSKNVTFTETKTIVYGLTTDEMKYPENFISHVTKTIEFNEDGTSKGIVEKNVLWLFDTVWVIDADTNDGLPYHNYQLIYIPDDFSSVGVPVVPTTLDSYYFSLEVDYPVSIISGVEGQIRIKVDDYYQLVYSPTGISMTWTTSDSSVVTVDNNGKIHGLKAGVATITATTKTGSSDSITVIVENMSYVAENLPEIISLHVGDEYDLSEIIITPTPVNDTVIYSISPLEGQGTNVASISGKKVIANNIGKAVLVIKVADTVFAVRVEVSARPDVTLTASTRVVTGYYDEMDRTGEITISNSSNLDLTYTYEFTTGEGIVNVGFNTNDKSKLKYQILGTGTAIVTVKSASPAGSVSIYFYIRAEQSVDLTLSSAKITGYYQDIAKTGSVTISNSEGLSLSYTASSSNASVVDVEMDGNSMNYTINGIGNATATIEVATAHYAGIAFVSFQIQDKPAVDEPVVEVQYVELSYSAVTIYEGDTLTLSATGTYNSLTWSSSNTSVASVSNGVITGKTAGTAIITVRTDDGAEAKCSVTVKAEETIVTTISVSPSSATIYQGETKQLKATGSGYSTVKWGTSNSSIATVSDSGKVTASSSNTGTVTITAYAKDSNGTTKATATATITIIATPAIVELELNATVVNVGTYVTATATINKTGTVTWSSTTSDSAETISGNTLTINTTNLSVGTYTITASFDGASDSKSFTVQDPNAYPTNGYIYTLAQLNSIRYNLDKDYVLAANIDVGEWDPIGESGKPFTGTLKNAGNFKLTNIQASDTLYAGLFGITNGADISGIIIEDSTFEGNNVGAIVGFGAKTSISNCKVIDSTIQGKCVGGIGGYIIDNSVISSCTITTSEIKSTKSDGYAGGIIGQAKNSSATDNTVSGTVQSTGGYVGGIVGHTNDTVSGCLVTATITTTTSNESYAGGIAGYSTYKIKTSTVRNSTITGYYAGGIAGTFNRGDTISLQFSDYTKGFRMEDLSSYSFGGGVSVERVAVKDDTTIKGVTIGGLFGVLKSGLVENCYSRATLNGVSSSSVKAGFAGYINASGFTNSGGSGQVGVIRYSYVAVKFSGSGTAHAVAGTALHNHNGLWNDNAEKTDGYVMNYVFDNDTDGNATYNHRQTTLFDTKDYVQAKKSTSEMKHTSTYTDKGFSATYWSFGSGYPTLKSEK